ncbi:MAG: exonuclease SbcCD subunit D [Clostridia bacterium]|nr:exonuclease SbcCD subunit D [Clostridia bacterium]
MKILHLSDLHIGKRVNDFSMLEDQEYILKKILNIIDEHKPQAVLIAGDVYDKSVPSAEAVQLFDDFLVSLSERDLKTFIISGNHDSPERLAFGARLMNPSGIYISQVYKKGSTPVVLEDEFGELFIYMLPFIKPAHVRAQFPDLEIGSYNDALKAALEDLNPEENKRNILITHQFVTGAVKSDSEEMSVGGSDNIDGTLFNKFDYVALGHIHRPQKMLRDTIRYSGTPLKYSFSEAKHQKSVTIIDFNEKNNIEIFEIPLIPKRDMREIKGKYLDITAKSYYENTNREDYLRITLTDEEEIPEALGKLRVIYPNIMKLDYDNTRTRKGITISEGPSVEKKSPTDLFSEFYQFQNNQSLNEEQENLLKELVEKIWEGQK